MAQPAAYPQQTMVQAAAPPAYALQQGQVPVQYQNIPQQVQYQQVPQQVTVVAAVTFGTRPQTMQCPHCQSQIQTKISSSSSGCGKY